MAVLKQRVVVIGHGYTSRLSIIRSIGVVGYDVDVVVIYYGSKKPQERPIDCYSKYVSHVFYSPNGDVDALVSLLLEHYSGFDEKPILVPESDFAVMAIDSNLNQLIPYFHIPNIDERQGAVVEWMDKSRQKEKAKSVGLNVATSQIIKIRNGQFEIPDNIDYPCFPKPVNGGKKGLGCCINQKTLVRSLQVMSERGDVDVLVEDYLNIDKEYALVGYSDGKTVYIPAILHNEKMANGGHFGVAKKGQVIPVNGYEDLIDKFKQLILEIHFTGLFDIDFLECQGVFYFDEINLRFGGSGYAVTKSGVNLPVMMVDDFVGKNRSNSHGEITRFQSFANERTCLDDWYFNFISFREYRNDIETSDICFIKDEIDPVPYNIYQRYVKKLRIKHLIKSIIR